MNLQFQERLVALLSTIWVKWPSYFLGCANIHEQMMQWMSVFPKWPALETTRWGWFAPTSWNNQEQKYGCFQKWGYPQIIHFNKVFHYKPSILGYHYFWKHPYTNQTFIGNSLGTWNLLNLKKFFRLPSLLPSSTTVGHLSSRCGQNWVGLFGGSSLWLGYVVHKAWWFVIVFVP